jgi:hypothetical protein
MDKTTKLLLARNKFAPSHRQSSSLKSARRELNFSTPVAWSLIEFTNEATTE